MREGSSICLVSLGYHEAVGMPLNGLLIIQDNLMS